MRERASRKNAPLEIRIDPEFQGPTLLELPDHGEGTIVARWEGTPLEIQIIERLTRPVILYVKTNGGMERAASVLGGKLKFHSELLENSKQAILNKNTHWRSLTESIGYNTTRAIITKLMADELRQGRRPKAATSVATDCLFGNLSPVDAEVVMRLRGYKDESSQSSRG